MATSSDALEYDSEDDITETCTTTMCVNFEAWLTTIAGRMRKPTTAAQYSQQAIVEYRIVGYHIVEYRIVSLSIVSYCLVSYCGVSYCIVEHRIVSYHIVSYHIVSHR